MWGKLGILKSKHVLVIGLGGVGAFAAEMIARAGIGKMTIVDGDVVNASNINRQLPALNSTIGKSKALLMKERLLDINPKLELDVFEEYLRRDLVEHRLSFSYDYVVDAIDTLSPKVFTILSCLNNGHKLISSMGAGGKIDPTQVKISRLKDSYNCKLAFKLRKRLGSLNAKKDFPVVFSSEMVNLDAMLPVEDELNKKTMVRNHQLHARCFWNVLCISSN